MGTFISKNISFLKIMNTYEHQQLELLTQFDKESSNHLQDMLFGDKLEKREKWFKLFESNPIFGQKHMFKDLQE